MTNPLSILVIIPTFNEAETIGGVITSLRELSVEVDILVVDDNSPDATAEIARSYGVEVLARPGKEGLGRAYLAGFELAITRGYEIIFEMDGDGSHRALDLPQILQGVRDGSDLVIGARWIPGGRVENWSKRRQFLSRVGNRYARWAIGFELRDSTSGFRAYRSHTLRQIGLESIATTGYCFQIDLARRTYLAGLLVSEVPITFVERLGGTSKMNRAIILEALWRISGWALARSFNLVDKRR